MARTTLCVGPHLNGWGIQERGEWRGPYLRQEMAVQIATAELTRRRSAGLDARLVVLGKDGAVLLEWPEPRSEVADVVELERPCSEGAAARREEHARPQQGGVRLRDWREARSRPRFNGYASLSIG